MKRFWFTLLLIPHFLITIFGSIKSDTLTIAVITDLHYLSPNLAFEGDALDTYERLTGRNTKDLNQVLEKVINDLIAEKIDILFVAGDITNHGERLSHTGFIEKILPLKKAGARIFVIPGNHDINIPDAKAYIGNNTIPTESITKEEFADIYKSFGYKDAICRDEVSLSYLSEINGNTWLLAIDSNLYDDYNTGYLSGGRIKPQTLKWILNILNEADTKGVRVLGMMHHGLIEHIPYQSTLFPDYLIEEWQKNSDLLADAGLEVVFTGHFHSNDITLRTSTAGNVIYDVETASLAQYPFAYRIMKLSDSDLSIDTRFITSIPGKPNLSEEYSRKLETITGRVARNRLKSLGIPFSEEMMKVLTDLIVKLNISHVKGDEKPDPEVIEAVRAFALFLGNEVNEKEYSFDFPPADNKLIIEFRSSNYK